MFLRVLKALLKYKGKVADIVYQINRWVEDPQWDILGSKQIKYLK